MIWSLPSSPISPHVRPSPSLSFSNMFANMSCSFLPQDLHSHYSLARNILPQLLEPPTSLHSPDLSLDVTFLDRLSLFVLSCYLFSTCVCILLYSCYNHQISWVPDSSLFMSLRLDCELPSGGDLLNE